MRFTAAISPKEINLPESLRVPYCASFQGLGSKFRFFSLSLVMEGNKFGVRIAALHWEMLQLLL